MLNEIPVTMDDFHRCKYPLCNIVLDTEGYCYKHKHLEKMFHG